MISDCNIFLVKSEPEQRRLKQPLPKMVERPFEIAEQLPKIIQGVFSLNRVSLPNTDYIV